jgi:signal peptidase I
LVARLFRELASSLLLAAVLFAGIDSVTARRVVEGPSMEPNLHRGQALLISRIGISGFSRLAYASTHPETPLNDEGWVPPRGAIVTLIHPDDPNTLLVKRVVGLPGEVISIDRGEVHINGKALAEPYVVFHDQRSMSHLEIPPDTIFVMGDNRPASGDSRSFGPVPRMNLLGVVVLRYWPPAEFRVMVEP